MPNIEVEAAGNRKDQGNGYLSGISPRPVCRPEASISALYPADGIQKWLRAQGSTGGLNEQLGRHSCVACPTLLFFRHSPALRRPILIRTRVSGGSDRRRPIPGTAMLTRSGVNVATAAAHVCPGGAQRRVHPAEQVRCKLTGSRKPEYVDDRHRHAEPVAQRKMKLQRLL